MIVEPDFLTHWKTRALVVALGYEAAPLCVLALWAHCQQRKTDQLAVAPAVFASICGYPFPADAQKFHDAMLSVGFIESNGGIITVHDFARVNAQLFANWQNGLRGGRPPKTEPKPTVNPSETHSANGVSDRLDKIGLDRIRGEKIDKKRVATVAAGVCEEIYDLYPKKVGKPDALRAIKKALGRGVTPEILKARTSAYATARGGDLEFVPNPATWFNQERYNDAPQTWAPRNGHTLPAKQSAMRLSDDQLADLPVSQA